MSNLSFRKTCLAIGVIQALSITPSFAATLMVDNTGESESACSLRNALNSINAEQNIGGCIAVGEFGANDAVNFAVSEVSGLQAELIITKDVLINSGGSPVVISADATTTNSRVLAIDDSSVEIDNITITGGRFSGRGDGGGVSARDSSLSLRNVVVTDNTTNGDGGGLYARNSQVFIDDSRFTNNSADDGGGINVRDSNVIIRDSVISGNRTLTATNSGDDGGGIYARSGTVSISNSTISGNSANDEGGGIFVRQSVFTLSNSTVSGNNVGDDGGGIAVNFQANASIIHSTFSNNTSGRIAGGISVPIGSLNLSNSLVVGNRANARVSPSSEISVSAAGELSFLGRNLVGDNSKSQAQAINFSPPSSVILATSDSSQATSLDSIISPLATNEGTTPTHALVQGSPAIDIANNRICESSPINKQDQRRLQRSELCDVGAFELGAAELNVEQSTIIPPILLLLLGENN